MELRGLVAALVALAVLAAPCAGQNVKGEVLVLDVGSLSYQGNHPMGPPIGSADGCKSQCENVAGCSAWTFCSSRQGCGSGCAAYSQAHPRLATAQGAGGNPTLPNPAWRSLAAIQGFGPWGSTAACHYECSGDSSAPCKPGDRWPFGLCTLKVLPPGPPQFWTTDASDGWVSGTVPLPAECSGLPARTCQRCKASKDAAACLACAKSPKLAAARARPLAERVAARGALELPDGCAACVDASQPARCIEALHANKTSATCALQNTAPGEATRALNVSACVACTDARGPRYAAACVSCAGLASTPGAVARCMACLGRASKVACAANEWPPTCWNPEAGGAPSCSYCAALPAGLYEACVACIERTPFSEDCAGCALLPDAAKAARCFACTKAAGVASGACSDCLKYPPDAAGVEQCLGCLTDRGWAGKAATPGRQWCFGCQNWCSDWAGRARCGACLQDASKDGVGFLNACACQA